MKNSTSFFNITFSIAVILSSITTPLGVLGFTPKSKSAVSFNSVTVTLFPPYGGSGRGYGGPHLAGEGVVEVALAVVVAVAEEVAM